MGIHPTAIIADGAELGEGVEVGPYCLVGPQVRLGNGCHLHSHVVIEGDTQLGESCSVYPHAVLGARPQDKKLSGSDVLGKLRIGSHNQIRESVTVHGGTRYGSGVTTIGDHNMLLVGCHIGHDAEVGNHTVFTNGSMAAGHTLIQDHAILGAMVGVHQFARVGSYAMLGAGARLSKDAPPFALVQGDRARLVSVNVIGLKRAGFTTEQLTTIKRAFNMLFWQCGSLAERVQSVQDMAQAEPPIQALIEFISDSKRGMVMPRTRHGLHEEICPAES